MRRIRECHDGLFERELTHRVIGTFYDVYNTLGYGFLESVYRSAFAIELTRRGIHVAEEVPVDVLYDGEVVGIFRADLLVESRLVLELKSCQKLTSADEMQVLNYLRATELELGLLFHFGPKPAFRRFISSPAGSIALNPRPSLSSVSSASAALRRTRKLDGEQVTSPTPASSGPHPPLRSAAYRTP